MQSFVCAIITPLTESTHVGRRYQHQLHLKQWPCRLGRPYMTHAPDQPSAAVQNIIFLLLPEYSMIALMSAIEALRISNRVHGQQLYQWQLISETNEPVAASNGMPLVPDSSIHEIKAEQVDRFFVCASYHPDSTCSPAVINWLKTVSRKAGIIGAMCTGSYLLARAGLLNGHRATIHWEAIPAFIEEFPQVQITEEIFEVDGRLCTCAGGTSSLDLFLYLIQQDYGKELALGVCDQFINHRIREPSDRQRLQLSQRLSLYNPKLIKVITLMEQSLDDPLTPTELADRCYISVRQMERLFKAHLHQSPNAYYLQLRLDRARQLLQQSDMALISVATACGFNSLAHFSRSYKNHFLCSPSQDRLIQSGK